MTFVSYAQNFEDVLLWRALHDVEHGRYLDIGAQDPVIDSVSLAFYEAGWRGIHVEAAPLYAARLRDARPDETVIEAAVTDAAGPIEFYEIPDTGLSTGKEEVASRHANAGFPGRKIVVPCVRLDQLLETAETDFHWLKIDVEGMEAEVLRSWGRSKRRPWLLVVESTFPNTQEPTEQLWIEEVLCRGYQQVFFDGLSRFFVHETHYDLADRFVAPANVFDGFAVAASHFAAREGAASFAADLENARATAAHDAAQLHAEVEHFRSTAAAVSDERDCARSALDAALVTRDAATTERDLAREKETVAQARLIATEREHRAALDALWRERHKAEEKFRHAALEVEQSLRNELQQAQAGAAKARVELARLEGRSGQQLEMLRRSDEATREVSDRHTQAQQQLAELRLLLAHLRSSIAKADALIRGVLSEQASRWQYVGQALGLARRSPAIQALSQWAGCEHEVTGAPDNSHPGRMAETGPSMLARPATEQRNPDFRANSLAELLSWNDIDFIRCAYVTALGRQPDPVGESYYVDRLRAGHSKIQVLWQLRKSPEGRGHDPGIAGLDRTLSRARWQRLKPFRTKTTSPTDLRTEMIKEDLISITLKLDDINGALTAKLDQVHVSLRLFEGYILGFREIQTEVSPVLDLALFKRNLTSVANKLESEVE